MNNPLEKFKFATLKNVAIKVDEQDDKIEIRIEPLDKTKKIEVYYKQLEHYRQGEFLLTDNHKDITIERSYPIGMPDGDVDWDTEDIYPCPTCKNQRTYQDELRKENKSLREILKSVVDLIS